MPTCVTLLDMSAECGGAVQFDGAHRAPLGTTEGVVMALPLLRATVATRKRKTMDIGRSLENSGISSLRSVHQISRKNGQIDRLSVHLSPQVSHGRKPDKAGCPTMLERVKPSRVKGSFRRASPALDRFSGVTEPRSSLMRHYAW